MFVFTVNYKIKHVGSNVLLHVYVLPKSIFLYCKTPLIYSWGLYFHVNSREYRDTKIRSSPIFLIYGLKYKKWIIVNYKVLRINPGPLGRENKVLVWFIRYLEAEVFHSCAKITALY